jgi:hypothetical protein
MISGQQIFRTDFYKEGHTMGKYLLLWSLNQNLMPIDPKERASGWGMLMEMVKQDLSKGIQKDWGSFTGENRGYCIVEGVRIPLNIEFVLVKPISGMPKYDGSWPMPIIARENSLSKTAVMEPPDFLLPQRRVITTVFF